MYVYFIAEIVIVTVLVQLYPIKKRHYIVLQIKVIYCQYYISQSTTLGFCFVPSERFHVLYFKVVHFLETAYCIFLL